MNDESLGEFKVKLTHLIWAAGGILLLWAASGLVIYYSKPTGGHGTFGDMFGAINSLFSGLAFASLIFATLMQREELKLQREELKLARIGATETREEIRGQKEQAIAQNKTLRQQTFDNTFFQLLRLHNDIVTSIDISRRNTDNLNGRDCFKFFYKQYNHFHSKLAVGLKPPFDVDLTHRINVGYSAFFKEYQADLGHYFRSIYNLMKFIDRSDIDVINKRVYSNLVRAQLSNFELQLLFYNCVSHHGSERFKPLVEKYALLKHFDFETAIHGEEDRRLYSSEAFGQL